MHDSRRTRRTIQAASNLAENPLGSLPAQMHDWKGAKALYRLLNEPDVTFAALMQPHVQQTREQAASSAVMLLVQDTTDIDLSHRHKISGTGQIGNERGRGFARANSACCASPYQGSAWLYGSRTLCAHCSTQRGTTPSTAQTQRA
ncbi:transposase DNA-binding-containing protein [Ktedonobacter sp. SOSP1-52]|uniref:transposase DNA-binding-containing protein n=1 Tax=Ktedonobacter sp. SOSP1-52 TaxID=2778366 RepID=UPI001F1C3A3F|nr:transposase DNA-binding-containing protein [Ktedonobacter sp. SOSP1-52]